jgi:hypothetical protein
LELKTGDVHVGFGWVALREPFPYHFGNFLVLLLLLLLLSLLLLLLLLVFMIVLQVLIYIYCNLITQYYSALSCCWAFMFTCLWNYYCAEPFGFEWYLWCVKRDFSTCAPSPDPLVVW